MPQIKPIFRPLGGWSDPKDPHPTSAQFKVDDRALWNDLSDEIVKLQSQFDPDECVVQLDVDESDIRVDGSGLRANHHVRYHGVVISFESRHGPLRFAADHYNSWWRREAWRANVRAITLHLAALRAIDRYGVARSGQQYVGWKALGPGDGTGARQMGSMTIVEAMTILEAEAGLGAGFFDARVERLTKQAVTEAYKRAVKRAHPDGGGSSDRFAAVQAAHEILMRNAR